MMNKQELEACLVELDKALSRAFPGPEPIQVLVVGGACLLLADVISRPTRDIDVIITDLEGEGMVTLVYQLTKTTRKMRDVIKSVGKRQGFPLKERMFFNDDCAPFLLDIGALPEQKLFCAYRKLHLYIPADFGYLLACKLMAGRPGKDYEDIEALLKLLGVQTRTQAQQLVNRFFPSLYDQQIHQLPATLIRFFPGG